MSTPPNEPAKPKSELADLYEPTSGDPFSAFTAPEEKPPSATAGVRGPLYDVPEPVIPVAPHRESGTGVKIVAALAVFALLLGAVIFWMSTKDTMHFGGGGGPTPTTATTTAPTTTSKPPPFAETGDCVLLTGDSLQPDYQKVACGEHNYTVAKVVESSNAKCDDGHVAFSRLSVLEKSLTVCLIPVFTDGECYDLTHGQLLASFPKKACGNFGVSRVKVLANTVDKAACGQDVVLALAYPDIKTTYCFTPSS